MPENSREVFEAVLHVLHQRRIDIVEMEVVCDR